MADASQNTADFARRFDHIEPETGLVLALLGHDMRAALTEVQAGLALLSEMPAPPETQTAVARCRTAGEALGLLVDQAMGVCLGQREPGLTAPTDIDTAGFLKDLHLRWSALAAEAGCTLVIEAMPDLPRKLRLDRAALQRVLANLVGNALTHGRGGKVAMLFGMNPAGCLVVSLTDEGPGFPATHLDHLQQGFALPAELRRPGGGLGLQSVKMLVDAMGGNINLANRPDRSGAALSLALPFAASTAQEPARKSALPDLRGRRLLAADDSAVSRALLQKLAAQLGAEIEVVADGAALLARLDSADPHALILDHEMPGLSGLDLLQRLQGRESSPPVLVITAHVSAHDHAALMAAGAAAVLTKPILCPVELGEAVLATLADKSELPLLDLASLHRLRQIAGPVAAAELFQRLTDDLTEAQAGLAQAAAVADSDALRGHSHVIVALAGTAGAHWLHDRAIALNAGSHEGLPVAELQAMAVALDRGIAQLLHAVGREAEAAGNPG